MPLLPRFLVLSVLAVPVAAQQRIAVGDEVRIAAASGGFPGTLDPVDRFGEGLTGVGDVDGDGIPDLAVGAPSDDGPGINRGAVHLLLMNADGTVRAATEIGEGTGGFPFALDDGACFGGALAALGDLDGDGIPDLAVGARDQDGAGEARGAVFVLFLTASGTVRAATTISEGLGGYAGTLDDFDNFGHGVAALGDVNGDGTTDLAVGATGDDTAGGNAGAVTILFLDAGGAVVGQQLLTAGVGGFVGPQSDGSSFGEALAGLGDLDGDGVPDLAVGAWGEDDGGPSAGAVWTLLLDPDGSVKAEQKLTEGSGGFDGDLTSNDAFGRSLANLGDLDGDGTPELAVGATGDDDGGSRRGAVWVLFLDPAGQVSFANKISQTEGYFDGPLDDADAFGWDVTTVGDLDGDGTIEIAVGAPQDDEGGFDTGAVWVLTLQSGPLLDVGSADGSDAFDTSATVTTRNGGGTNPVVFAAATPPILGTTWNATVDTSGLGGTGFTLAAYYAGPSSGILVGAGELLVDPTTALLATTSAFAFGGSGTHSIAIASDPSIAGDEAFIQVLVSIGGVDTLTNALDVRLGY